MNKIQSTRCRPLFCQTALAASLLLAFGSASAQETAPTPDEMRRELYTPTSQVSIGLGYQSSDNRRFGSYRGLTGEEGYGLLDLDLVKRDDATGTWMKLRGKDLGLGSRELRLDHERQGDWSYSLQGSQAPRIEPLIVNTGLQGIGSAIQTVNSTAAKRDVDLRVNRDTYALGIRKFISGGFDVRVSAKQEESSGDRMFGHRVVSPMEFLTEPVDRVTRQWEVVAGYADRKLQLSGGYNGSAYENNMPILTVNSVAGATTTTTPLATAPSNHAHQLHLAGGYNLSDSTRTTFKMSRTRAYQSGDFDSTFTPKLAGSPTTLNGKLATTLVFADLTTRPTDRLNLTGMVRYENRDDHTPEIKLITAAAPQTSGAFSSPGLSGITKSRSLKQLKGALEASYQLDDGYRLIGSLEQEDLDRNGPIGAISGLTGANAVFNGLVPLRVAYRPNTSETIQRIEFKRTMSDTLNGGVALIHSNRRGSDYVPDTFVAAANTNQVNPLIWADRSRNKVRLTADWIPSEQWSLQFLADYSDDTYSGRNLGPRTGKSEFFSGDLNYRINDKWNLTSWLSREKILAKQGTRTDPGAGAVLGNVLWNADIRDTSTAFGIGVKGKALRNLEIGADLSRSLDVADHELSKVGGTGTTPVDSLPSFYYRQLSLRMFADYALQRNSGVRLNMVVDRRRNNDWTWTDFTYNDGTTVTNVPSENTTFVGVSYYYRWR